MSNIKKVIPVTEDTVEIVEKPVTEGTVEIVENPVAEDTVEIVEKPVTKNVEEKPVWVEEPIEQKNTYVKGFVTNCNALRVRVGTNLKSTILGILPKDTTVSVSLNNSTESFYEVKCVINGSYLTGFCVKKFIEIVQ